MQFQQLYHKRYNLKKPTCLPLHNYKRKHNNSVLKNLNLNHLHNESKQLSRFDKKMLEKQSKVIQIYKRLPPK